MYLDPLKAIDLNARPEMQVMTELTSEYSKYTLSPLELQLGLLQPSGDLEKFSLVAKILEFPSELQATPLLHVIFDCHTVCDKSSHIEVVSLGIEKTFLSGIRLEDWQASFQEHLEKCAKLPALRRKLDLLRERSLASARLAVASLGVEYFAAKP